MKSKVASWLLRDRLTWIQRVNLVTLKSGLYNCTLNYVYWILSKVSFHMTTLLLFIIWIIAASHVLMTSGESLPEASITSFIKKNAEKDFPLKKKLGSGSYGGVYLSEKGSSKVSHLEVPSRLGQFSFHSTLLKNLKFLPKVI